MLNNRKGFTLIELLIVVVIIGILAAIAIPKFAQTKDKARVAAAKSEVKTMMTSMESYYTDHNTYPAGLGDINVTSPTSSGVTLAIGASGDAGYTVTGTVATAGGDVVCTANVGSEAGNTSTDADGVIHCPPPAAAP